MSQSLEQAVRDGDIDQCKRLIDFETDINQVNDKGLTLLEIACYNDNADICKLLLKSEIRARDEIIDKCLKYAVGEEYMDICKLLLKHEIRVRDEIIDECLITAVDLEYMDICKLLIAHGADVNQQVLPNRPSCTLLWSAALYANNADICKLLIENGARVDPDSLRDQLETAALDGDARRCKVLLYQGADVHLVNKSKMSALWRACDSGHVDVCRLLIEWGADVNQADDRDESPLWIACWRGYRDVCKLLLDNGADIEQMDENGDTPLMIAKEEGHENVCKLLLNNGATIQNDKLYRQALEEEHRRHKDNMRNLKRKFTRGEKDYMPPRVRQRLTAKVK